MPGGGVCAVLDYDVDHMAQFVADMATSVVVPNNVNSHTFRKFVSGILSSTRLPKSTILLGMNYLAKRVNSQKTNPMYQANDAEVWRMLTVALILASKFLDDNTFQNRSWAEVSGIAVSELNALEKEWLVQCNFSLYVNLDFSHDYTAWGKSWEEWKVLKEQSVARHNRERMAPIVPAIETDVSRFGGRSYNTWMQQQTAEYEKYQAIKRGEVSHSQAYRMGHLDWASNSNVGWHNAPLTPPDSGYGTPEYINSAASTNAGYNEWFSSATNAAQWNRYQQPHNNPYYGHGQRRNVYTQQQYPNYGPAMWEHNVAECSCANCLAPIKHQGYFGQPVMG